MPVPQTAPQRPSPTAQPIATSLAASLPKKATGNTAIYATSTDRRTQEVEFFKTIVKRTEECVLTSAGRAVAAPVFHHFRCCFRRDFLDVSQSAMDYHEEEVDDGGLGAKLRTVPVQPDRMEFSGVPRPSGKNQDHAAAILAYPGLPAQRIRIVEAATAAIAAGLNEIMMRDGGKQMVVQFRTPTAAT